MQTVFVNGVNLSYASEGEGFPLIGLTGKASSMDAWHPAIRAALSESYRFIILDQRGTGRSDAPTEAYSISDMARDVVSLMDALGIEKAHLLGQSMGGMIAQEIAIAFPSRVEKLVLCATTCGIKRVPPTWRMIRWLLRRRRSSAPEAMLEMLYTASYLKNHPDVVESFIRRMSTAPPPNARTIEIHEQASKQFDSYRRLGSILAPTLIIHGQEDWVFSPKHAKLLNRHIAGSKLILYPGAGHGVFSQENRKVLNGIQRFL